MAEELYFVPGRANGKSFYCAKKLEEWMKKQEEERMNRVYKLFFSGSV